MAFLFISFIAGVLTVLAPCILPLLPVIIGGSLATGGGRRRTGTIIISLIVSIVLFTLLLKWSSAFINVPQSVWTSISGIILVLFAVTMIFPALWEKIPFVNRLSIGSNKVLGAGMQKKSLWGDIVMGAALGPVFSSCSPTYFVILATVLPASFAEGLLDLFAYALGLGLALLLIAILGQKLVSKLGKVSDPHGWFKKSIGVLFLIVGVAILIGADKKLESKLLDNGAYRNLANIETRLITKNEGSDTSVPDTTTEDTSATPSSPSDYLSLTEKMKKYDKYHEIVNPSGFVNTDGLPVTVGQYIGKKVVLIDFMTYSCINCIRTFPYLNDWYTKYEDKGLVIIGIHTPEFAFEKNIDNVTQALHEDGIQFPVVLDNDYGTWRAWGNQFWPRKYLIDIDGYVVYDHIGEGKYDETEEKIVDLLNERANRLGLPSVALGGQTLSIPEERSDGQSPETYFGPYRNKNAVASNLGSCTVFSCSFSYDTSLLALNKFALSGSWSGSTGDYVALQGNSGGFGFHFRAGKVFLVASGGGSPVTATVFLDGVPLPSSFRGEDVSASGTITFNESRLYSLVDFHGEQQEHVIEVKTDDGKGWELYTLTFGM